MPSYVDPGNFALPAPLGACADELLRLRDTKDKLQREIDAIESQERAVREYLLSELPKDDASGVLGTRAKAVIRISQEPTCQDWQSVYAHITATGDFSLLQRRLSKAAIKERWAAGEVVPGVGVFNVTTVSVTKI